MGSNPQSEKEELPIRIREAIQPDIPFVYSSWLHQHCHSAFAAGVPKAIFFSNHRRIIDELITKADLYVACDASDLSVMYGFICGEEHEWPLVHYAYVKKKFRGFGIGKMLLEQLGWEPEKEVVTSHFFAAKPLRIGGKKVLYNPYILHNIQIEVTND